MRNPVSRRWFYLEKIIFIGWTVFWLLLGFGVLIDDLPWYGQLMAGIVLIITTPSGFASLFESYENFVESKSTHEQEEDGMR